jgi:hypothetical protein
MEAEKPKKLPLGRSARNKQPMPITKIITHPGGAHKDEFLACSLFLATHPVPILRREPTPSDLADPTTCVIDVGHEHAPERNNFDHHQFPREHVPTCSISLVLEHLGLYEDALRFCEWLEPAEWFDCRGPVATAQWMGVERDALGKLNSPIDVTLLRRFALCPQLDAGEPLWEIMRMIGEDLLEYVRSLRDRLHFIHAHHQLWEIPVESGSCTVLYLPRTDPMPDEPSMGLGRYVDSHGLKERVVGLIYPDRRGGGYGLSRFNDDSRLDFCRLSGEPDVHFAHQRGFLAKVSATSSDRLKELMAQAWTGR